MELRLMQILTDRQEKILGLIVHEYVENPKTSGVSSQILVDKHRLDWSTATVRNEMALLSNLDLLHQPHTSAGRIPTEIGYRYFVRYLVKTYALPQSECRKISHQFYQARTSVNEWGKLAANVLARHTQVAGLVTALHSHKAQVKHIELISTYRQHILLVLVLLGGEVLQEIFSVDYPISQTKLSDLAERLTKHYKNRSANHIENQRSLIEDNLENTILHQVSVTMQKADSFAAGELYLDGIQNVLSQREFTNSEPARNALQLLEKRTYMENFLESAIQSPFDGVTVVIAGEGDWKELKECSMVLARYGSPNIATGTLGVFGPTRMAYDRAIGAVRHVANLMTQLVHDSYG